ncbi:MAG: flavodoxin family protein [Planctomycetota bacterium]
MDAVVISGSRNPNGQTARASQAFLDGIQSAGGRGETVFLTQVKLERCRQCDERGWGICRSEGWCVIEDDFAGITDKIRTADLAVFATPVYFSDLSESMKAFLDRLRRITRHEEGKKRIEGRRAVGICVAGGGGGGAPACTLSLEKVLATCGFDVVDMIPVRRQNLEMKLEVLRLTGKWAAASPPQSA